MKKFILVFSAALLVCGLTCCEDSSEEVIFSEDLWENGGDDGDGTTSGTEVDDGSPVVVYTGADGTISKGETISINVNKSVFDHKYMCIDLETDVRILGTIEYCPVDDTSNVYSEYFYTEPTDEPLYQFLDFFRGGQGFSGDIYVISMTFENVSSSAGTFNLKEISFSNREITESELFIQNDYIKVGVSLENGGAIHYMEGIGREIKQVYNSSGSAAIVVGECPDDYKVGSENINLLNHSDTGRLLQQSYYGELYEGVYWNDAQFYYNPVQGGSTGNVPSQLVDYRVSDTEIYTKCIPMDWAIAEKTRSYMESWITLEADGVVKVSNRYTDYTGVNHGNKKMNQELPAFYVNYLLEYVAIYNGSRPFTGADLTRTKELGFWANATSYNYVNEFWHAWVNEQNFGIGIFVPGLTKVSAGRYPANGDANPKYDEEIYSEAMKVFGRDASTLSITDYGSHVTQLVLPTYGTLEYNYFVMVDYVDTIRATFNALAETENNDSLLERAAN